MKRTHWAFFWFNTGILFLLAMLAYVGKAGVEATYLWLRWLAEPMASRPALFGLGVACAGLVGQIAERSFSSFEFRKKKVRRLLDQMVKELLEGNARDHRLTLFRAAPGWRVWMTFLVRIWGQERRWRLIQEYLRIHPFGLYLYVYVRPTRSYNDRSCVCYRVFRNHEGSEGVAGMVWERDQWILRNLPIIPPGSLKDMPELTTYRPGSAVLEYARLTNISRASQLRARQRYARHFYGTVLEGGETSTKWGVLLVDSTKSTCPFPEDVPKSRKWDHYEASFETFTQVLTNLLT